MFNITSQPCIDGALAGLALCICVGAANAQDVANVQFSGQLMSSTCRLMISDDGPGPAMNGNSKLVSFGVINTSNMQSLAAGNDVGPARNIVFALKGPDGLSACDTGNPHIRWMPSATFNATQIGRISGSTADFWYLKNTTDSTNGGSNVWLKLMVSEGGQLAQPALLAGNGFNFSAASQSYSLDASVTLVARLVRSVEGVPTAGPFNQSIPVTVNYK